MTKYAQPLKVIIIEDEALSAEHLAMLLHKLNRNIEVVRYFDTVKETIRAFEEGIEVDLMFVDIHLADGNSFEIFSKILIKTPVIFTTAYDQYAIKAFKQNSIDYLLKPLSLPDLQYAIDKYDNQQNSYQSQIIGNVTAAYHQIYKTYKTRFLVKMGQSIESISTEDIHHFDTRDSISFVVTDGGQRFPVDYTLDQLETLLPPKDFFRINRKVIIQFTSITKVNTYFNGRLTLNSKYLDSEAKIVSRERVKDFKLWLDDKI